MNYFGMYKGICIANNDPEGLYRIRVQVPVLFGEQNTDWAWPCVPPGWPKLFNDHPDPDGALSHVATTPVPKPGDGVWVAFEAGDETKPLWLGTWLRRA